MSATNWHERAAALKPEIKRAPRIKQLAPQK